MSDTAARRAVPTPAPTPLPTSAPSAQGVDAAGVQKLIDTLEAQPGVEPHSVMVIRHGHVVAAGAWWPYRLDRAGLVYSLSKSFTATALGLAVGDGLVDLDGAVLDHFPEIDPATVPARARRRTVREIASMRTGHRRETWADAVTADRDDPVAAFLRMPVTDYPGTTFAYNQPPVMTVAALVERATGSSLTEYLHARLLDPIGAGPIGRHQFPAGRDLGFSGMFVAPDTVARLGLLYLADGRWGDRQVLPPGWAATASAAASDTSGEPFPDWQQGYGFGFWRARHGYRGDGAWGQFCLVLPEQDAVVVLTSAVVHMQDVLDAVWTHLLPALGSAAITPSADEALAARLATLTLAPARGTSWTPQPPASRGLRLDPLGGSCAALAGLVSVGVESDGRVVLTDDTGDTATGAPGDDTGPVVVAVGWPDDDTVLIDVIFADTPHRLLLVGDARSSTFTASWRTTPLHAVRLRELRMPGDAPVVLAEASALG